MSTTTLNTDTYQANRGSSLRNLLATVWQTYRKHRDARRSIGLLRSMDDRMLKDIGITRVEIEYTVLTGRKPD